APARGDQAQDHDRRGLFQRVTKHEEGPDLDGRAARARGFPGDAPGYRASHSTSPARAPEPACPGIRPIQDPVFRLAQHVASPATARPFSASTSEHGSGTIVIVAKPAAEKLPGLPSE